MRDYDSFLLCPHRIKISDPTGHPSPASFSITRNSDAPSQLAELPELELNKQTTNSSDTSALFYSSVNSTAISEESALA